MEIDIFIIPQIIQKSNPIIALLFIQNDYWLIKKKNSQNNFTSIHVKVLSSVACFSASSGDKAMFNFTHILQIANVVHRVVFLLFLLPWNMWNFASFCTELRRQRNLVPRSFRLSFSIKTDTFRTVVSVSLGDRVLSRIYRFGGEVRFLGGSGGMLPRKFFEWIFAEMQSGAFWDPILRNVTVVFYSIF